MQSWWNTCVCAYTSSLRISVHLQGVNMDSPYSLGASQRPHAVRREGWVHSWLCCTLGVAQVLVSSVPVFPFHFPGMPSLLTVPLTWISVPYWQCAWGVGGPRAWLRVRSAILNPLNSRLGIRTWGFRSLFSPVQRLFLMSVVVLKCHNDCERSSLLWASIPCISLYCYLLLHLLCS